MTDNQNLTIKKPNDDQQPSEGTTVTAPPEVSPVDSPERTGVATHDRMVAASDDAHSADTNTANDYGNFETYADSFRDHYDERHADASAQSYEAHQPYYRYGYDVALDSRFSGNNWNDSESTIRADWEQNNPDQNWDDVRDPIAFAWDKVRGHK